MTDSVNYIWLDSETTGLNSVKSDVVQLACIAVINGVEQPDTFNEHCQPINWNAVEPEALAINGLTLAQLKTFQKPEVMVDKLIKFVKKFGVKFTIAGYNVDFDRGFISSLFKKVGREQDFADLFHSDTRDLLKRVRSIKKQFPTPNIKLATLAKHFDIPINAHDALSDISATIKLDKIVAKMLGDVETFTQVEVVVDNTLNLPEPAQLHCHSTYSYSDSVPHIEEWIEHCLKNKIPAFSIVDHGNAASSYHMIRIPEIIEKMNKSNKTTYDSKGLTGIPGCGLCVSHEGQSFYLNAWAVGNTGYRNLLKLSSLGWLHKVSISNVEFPVVPLDKVIELQDDIIFGVPGINGPVTPFLMAGQPQQAEELILLLNKYLNIRLELAAINVTRHFDTEISGFRGYSVPGGNMQAIINKFYFELANKHKLHMVPVSDAHYIDPNDKVIQDCVSKNTFKDNRYFSEGRHQMSSNEMYAIIKSHVGDEFTVPLYNSLVDNTYAIAQMAAGIEIKHEYHLPKIHIPDDIKATTSDYDKQLFYLTMRKCKEHGRWNDSPEYKDRLKKEIDVIMKNPTLNFLPYFLMYEDICAFAASKGLLQNIARGSAGGSLLSFYLKIIHIDPIAMNLPFERFLSHARIRAGSFPDIDLDLSKRARPQVMKYLQEKYGLGFAQIATFSKMKTKNAIKDAMWALYGRHRNDPEVKAVTEAIDDSPQGVDEHDFLYGYTDDEDNDHKGEVEKKEILANFFAQKPDIERMVKRLIGSISGYSRHASAFVISTIDLSGDRVPTMMMEDKELGSILVTQFDASMVEKSGLVKADILGINTLNMVSDCVDLIKKNHGIDLLEEEKGVAYIYRLPEDSDVYKDFFRKDTDSSFQFNSDVIKGAAQEFAPKCKADLSLMTALYRPGAMDAQLDFVLLGSNSKVLGKEGRAETIAATKKYVGIKNYELEETYIHDDLKPYLSDTLGIIVYQEQVMSILVAICGYSLEETDVIRSAIAKKKHEVIMSTFDRIRTATASRGWSLDEADMLCNTIMAFSRYSFNKSHSCFAYDQLIKTDDGFTKIGDLVAISAKVASFNEKTQEVEYIEPKRVWCSGHRQLYDIVLEDGTLIQATDDHMVLTVVGWRTLYEAFEGELDILCQNQEENI